MTLLVSGYIEHFTYLGLLAVLILCGLGLPVPEDVALLAGGFLAHRGITRYPLTLIVSLVGVVAGDNSLYLVGRRFGDGLLGYLKITHPHAVGRIDWLRDFMRRHGKKTILYARFLAGLRALIYLSAGSLGVTWREFAFFDLLGALISVPIVVSAGYLFGSQIEVVVRYIGGFERMLALIAVLSAVLYLSGLMTVTRRDDSTP